ncbi:MAG: nucleoside permease nupX [Deltaproteobacteria bacterium]|nr:nucleoside permease nupX [Deltaproteobacteria bacterium]
MEEWPYRLLAFTGFFSICFIAWVTGTRQRVNGKVVIGSMILAWVIAIIIFWVPGSKWVLGWMNDVLVSTLAAAQKGSIFLFGPLAVGPGQSLPDGTPSIGFILAMQALPAVVFFAALVGGLYYLNILPAIVRLFARLFYRAMGLSGAEALAASANIFVGIESTLAIQPYLLNMTRSELLTVLTCMMATVASTVMAIYVTALHEVFPQIAGHLLSASVISIPCAVLISKLFLPEEDTPLTVGNIPSEASGWGGAPHQKNQDAKSPSNLITALIEGGAQGVKMVVAIATLLIVFLGLESVVDLALEQLPWIKETPLSVTRILSWLAWPFAILLGLRPDEWQIGAELLGVRFVQTEVAAYFQLAAIQSMTPPPLSMRSLTALTYALCGFVHIASVGIFVGGLGALIPSRTKEVSLLGLRALWTAFLATLLTGCLAGVLSSF